MADKFRKGDQVAILGTVEYVIDGRVKLLFSDNAYGPSHTCDVTDVEMVTPYFANGEMVMTPAREVGTVISVHDGSAWVHTHGGYATWPCKDLHLRFKAEIKKDQDKEAEPVQPPMLSRADEPLEDVKPFSRPDETENQF